MLTNLTQNQQKMVRHTEHKTCIDTKRWELKYTRSSRKQTRVVTCNVGVVEEDKNPCAHDDYMETEENKSIV